MKPRPLGHAFRFLYNMSLMYQDIELLRSRKEQIGDILLSVPFTPDNSPIGKHFLGVYLLTYKEMCSISEEIGIFVDSNKLLKLGISLGNLLKRFEQEDKEVQIRQGLFIKALNNLRMNDSNYDTGTAGLSLSDPFKDSGSVLKERKYKTVLSNNRQFLKNFLSILKSFDIGTTTPAYLYNLPTSRSTSGSSTVGANLSPIKLDSRQLLIEKLEIKIKLDNLFIYKTVLRMIYQIYSVIEQALILDITESDTSSCGSHSEDNEDNGIRYPKINDQNSINAVVNRISTGVIEPLMEVLLNSLIKPKIKKRIDSFLSFEV